MKDQWFKKLRFDLFIVNPARVLIAIYFLIMVVGFLLLSLPFTQKTSTAFIDNLFISTSAVSTTGLTSVSVSDTYNFLGQLIILLLIQVGAFTI